MIAVGREAAKTDAFDVVFELHHDYVYRLTYALLGHAQDAEDVTQEVFLRVYKALPSYDPARASLRTWLARLTSHWRRAAWLNPHPLPHWGHTQSIGMVKQLMEGRMYPLTVAGLDDMARGLTR